MTSGVEMTSYGYFKLGVTVLLCGFLLVLSASAGTVTIVKNPGTTYQTTALTGFSTHGDEMAGMVVTATFLDSSVNTATWAATGFQAGKAPGTGWYLSESGDTFDGTGTWTLSNGSGKGIKLVQINAGPGNTVFDTIIDPMLTPGSARGWPFELHSGGASLDITATYTNLVALSGFAPEGDLYRNLDLAFTNAGGFPNDGSDLLFHADTDSLKYKDDLTPVVPEPGTLLLLGSGLVGVARFIRRKIAA